MTKTPLDNETRALLTELRNQIASVDPEVRNAAAARAARILRGLGKALDDVVTSIPPVERLRNTGFPLDTLPVAEQNRILGTPYRRRPHPDTSWEQMRRRTRGSGERWHRRYRNLKLIIWDDYGWIGHVGSEPLTEIKDGNIRNCFTCRSDAMQAAEEMADRHVARKEQKRNK